MYDFKTFFRIYRCLLNRIPDPEYPKLAPFYFKNPEIYQQIEKLKKAEFGDIVALQTLCCPFEIQFKLCWKFKRNNLDQFLKTNDLLDPKFKQYLLN